MPQKLDIEIDCAPGALRPDYFFEDICSALKNIYLKDKKSGIEFIENINKNPITKLFGCWKWEINFDKENKEHFEIIQEVFKKKLTNYYNKGFIRYGSW